MLHQSPQTHRNYNQSVTLVIRKTYDLKFREHSIHRKRGPSNHLTTLYLGMESQFRIYQE